MPIGHLEGAVRGPAFVLPALPAALTLDALHPMRELLWNHRRLFYAVAAFSFVVNLLMLAPSFYWMAVFDRVMTSRSESTLFYLTVGVIATLLIIMVLEILRARMLVVITVWMDRRVGPLVFDALVTQGGRPEQPPYPEGMRDLYTVRSFVTGAGVFALFDAPWLPIYLVVISLFSPLLGAFALAGALILFAVGWVNEKLSRDALDTMHRDMAASSRFVDGAQRNAESVLSLGMLPGVRRRWAALNERSLARQAMTANVVGATLSLTRLTRQIVQIMMLCAGAWLILEQHTSPGVMIAATFIASRALVPVEMLLSSWTQFAEARAAYRRLDAFLGAQPAQRAEQLDLGRPRGAVSAEQAGFNVPNRVEPILANVTFSVAPGEMVGVIGPSGSGKSTLARLLVGLWAPTTGAMRFDGAELANWSHDALGRHVGYLPQDVELFPGTVAENIARLNDPDPEAVIRAAKRARVHDMILRLPQGYDTPVTEAGYDLSGGQRQRIGLARALYGEPPIVVLDEPNASLDGDGEAMLAATLAELKATGVTVFVVAHRPSVLAGADRILVLREGRMEAFAPRNEVFARYVPSAVPQAA